MLGVKEGRVRRCRVKGAGVVKEEGVKEAEGRGNLTWHVYSTYYNSVAYLVNSSSGTFSH